MIATITGTKSKTQQKLFMMALDFYLSKLLSKRIINHLTVDIEIKKRLDEDASGYCDVVGCNTRNKPRDFTIQIERNKSLRYMLMTLAHECVHLKQYALGEIDDNLCHWKGKRVHSKTDYWDSPWEIEAHGREVGLYTRFAQHHNLKIPRTAVERDS